MPKDSSEKDQGAISRCPDSFQRKLTLKKYQAEGRFTSDFADFYWVLVASFPSEEKMAAVGRWRVQREKVNLNVSRCWLWSEIWFCLHFSWRLLLPFRNIHIQVIVICRMQSHLNITLDSFLSKVDQMSLRLWPTLVFLPYAPWTLPADMSSGECISQLSHEKGQIVLDPCLREQLAFSLWSTGARGHSRNTLLFSASLPGTQVLSCSPESRGDGGMMAC